MVGLLSSTTITTLYLHQIQLLYDVYYKPCQMFLRQPIL
jgi:hypothetical protein